ncbi:DUF1922 domain-containing protein [Archaeoglobales archaeon]|nr:MAG: DUF1922 domain-containing protein [Archaeoglobales archaeon]
MTCIVFRCRKCGRYLHAKENVKMRKCVCGFNNDLKKVKVVAKAVDEKAASEIVRKLQGDGTLFRSLDG